jgi:urocanate hydratase
LAIEAPSQSAFDFVAGVARAYTALVEAPHSARDSALGGQLFCAGELNEASRALIVAANIAGAATLAATSDRALQKQALRDGIVDFVVNNLDEALRILKNQLRKRETVAVCVGLPPLELKLEMNERGVLPDLVRSEVNFASHHESPLAGNEDETKVELSKIPALVTWRADSTLPKDLAALDEIALSCIEPEDWKSRRWLHLAPRYLGRMSEGLRLIESNREFAARFWEKLRHRTDRGEIAFAFEIRSFFRGVHDQFRFDPQETPPAKPS